MIETSATVLAFDTSGPHCIAALTNGDRVIASLAEDRPRGQSERLFPLLESLLAEAGLGWRDLSRIGVGVGPGNFTGIRISVSAARGLALSLGIPAVGISRLDALALGHTGDVVTVIAGRGETLYVQCSDGSAPVMAALSDLPELPKGAIVVGDGSERIAERIGGVSRPPARPMVEAIAALARSGDGRPTPLYLRPADAAPSRDVPPVRLT